MQSVTRYQGLTTSGTGSARKKTGLRFCALPLLVRTWNVFHGNALPPRRRGFLQEMIELVCDGRPDVVCLQEIPVWGIARLERWSWMQAFPVVARSPRVPRRIGTPVTRLNQGLFRSAFVGQANAVLVASHLEAADGGHASISDRGRERRVVQVVRIAGRFLVGNLHANRGPEVARLELERARAFVESFAGPDDVVVLAGDFNLSDIRLAGYSEPATGIDHVLVKGGSTSPPVVWPGERRMRKHLVLSDHAPVEVTIEPPSPSLGDM